MQIILNNTPYEIVPPLTLQALLVSLDLAEKRLALLRNGSLVPRTQYQAVFLEENDVLEVIHAIGGG